MICRIKEWNKPDLRPYGFMRALVARMVRVHFTSRYSTLFFTFAIEFVPMIIVGLGTLNSGSLDFDSGLFVSWFWHSWFSHFSVQLHFCTYCHCWVIPHFHRIVRLRTLRQNREDYNLPQLRQVPFSTCRSWYSVHPLRLSAIVWISMAYELGDLHAYCCCTFGFVRLVIVIQLGPFPISRTGYLSTGILDFVTTKGVNVHAIIQMVKLQAVWCFTMLS